jgi:hypothetical protein
MLRYTLPAAAVVVAAVAPSASAADYPLPRHVELEKYTALYHAVKSEDGARAPGRNIRRWGLSTGQRIRKASAREIAQSIRQLRALRNPLLKAGPPPQEPGGVATPRAGGTLAAIAACESGGNPRAISPDGTYRGKYQFDFGTWAAVGGSGDPAAASEAEQDQRAAALYARRGAAPWPICGR